MNFLYVSSNTSIERYSSVFSDYICIDSICFEIELANTAEKKRKGLMFREELSEDKGMLFPYIEEQFITIWMKNTLIPLDIIWFDKNLRVVHIHENAVPKSLAKLRAAVKASYVLEINAGLVKKKQIKLNDVAFFSNQDHFKPKEIEKGVTPSVEINEKNQMKPTSNQINSLKLKRKGSYDLYKKVNRT